MAAAYRHGPGSITSLLPSSKTRQAEIRICWDGTGGREALPNHLSAPEVEEAICHETLALLRAPCTTAVCLRGCQMGMPAKAVTWLVEN